MGISTDRSSNILSARWRELCEAYLPVITGDEWRYSRRQLPGDPDQGWKLHVAATILTANETLEKIAAELKTRDVLYKAPVSLGELGKINSGIIYAYSQVGKFITIYPQNEEDAVLLADKLHGLTGDIAAPAIPFDKRFRPESNIYYRYGAFKYHEIEGDEGVAVAVIRGPNGDLVPDPRDQFIPPSWVTDPFPAFPAEEDQTHDSPLKTTYRIFRALSQRGKGGVYNAFDMSRERPRLCVVKEGRRNGEVDWDGFDGYDYVKREARSLRALESTGFDVPGVYDSFEVSGNFYLVTEYIDGQTLDAFLRRRRRRLSLKKAIELSIEISQLMERIHGSRWAWHDCKPSNILITKKGKLRPIDFEGARAFDDASAVVWGTGDFLPPEWRVKTSGESIVTTDLYALGAIIYCLLGGRYYDNEKPVPLEKLRKGVPPKTAGMVSDLLGTNPRKRPVTGAVLKILRRDLAGLADMKR